MPPRGVDALTRFLQLRPDLTQPAPTSLADLGRRAQRPGSVRAALQRLDDASLRVLIGLAAQLDAADLATRAAGRLDEVMAELRELELVTGDPPRAGATVRALLGRYPGGLAPASGQPLDPEMVTERLARLGDAERAVLERLAWGPPVGTLADAGRLIELGLLLPVGPDAVLLPREVALALRGDRVPERPAEFTPPESDIEPLEPEAAHALARRLLAPAPTGGRAVLTRAQSEDRWVELAYATEDGSTHHEVVRVLTIGHGSAYLVRRHGRRLTVPLKRVVQAKLGDPVVIWDPSAPSPS